MRVSKIIQHLEPSELNNMAGYTDFADDDIVILSATRTPMGAFQGALSTMTGPTLGGIAIKGALERGGVAPEQVDEVYMGCAIQAGVGQNPARQALLQAGIPNTCPATTVNKVCASGMKSVAIGMGTIKMGYNSIVVCGGMESMTNAPHLVGGYRGGIKMGHQTVKDCMISDGLWDVYNDSHMGVLGELCAEKHNISREEQDQFSISSFKRAQESTPIAAKEITPVSVPQRRGDPVVVGADEPPTLAKLDKLPKLRAVFKKGGTITAGNASSIADGAAALVICTGAKARELKQQPLAKILSYADAAQDPKFFTTAPALAVPLALKRAGISPDELGQDDYFELNEAFSVVGLANTQLLKIDPARTNVFGGAVSMGHPLGCSGARILVTLLNVLDAKGGRYGIAGICNGGGGASAMVLQRLAQPKSI